MAYALVQSRIAFATSLAFSSPVSAGNLIVVGIAQYNSLNDPTDGSNTYTRDATKIGSDLGRASLYSAVAVGSSAYTVSCTNADHIVLMEFSGNASSSVAEAFSDFTGTGSSWATGSVTVSNSNSLIVGFSANASTWGASSSPANGFTEAQREDSAVHMQCSAIYKAVSASDTANWTSIGGANVRSAVAVSYKPTGGGGITTHNLTLLGVGG